MRIGSYVHACIVQDDGPSMYLQDVDQWDYMSGITCQHCGEPLVTTEQLLAHIYVQLTED